MRKTIVKLSFKRKGHQTMCEFKEAVKKHRDGAILNLFVTPGDRVVFPAGYNPWRKRVEIKVCSEAKDNKANKEVINTIAEFFNKSVSNVVVVSGEKSREKTLLVEGVSVDEIMKRLKGYL